MEWLNKFGVPALFGTFIIVGTFVLLWIGVSRGDVSFEIFLPVLGSWVGSIVTAVFVVKGISAGRGK